MKIIFFGSSDFSLKALEACQTQETALVISTPDREKGRGLKTVPTPVKVYAESQGLACITPDTLKDSEVFALAKKIHPDLFVVSSYGKMIPQDWLEIPSRLSVNVHPSLIPKYRGAAPINWPILNGDKETGLTLMDVTKDLDAGDIFYQKALPLSAEMNSHALSELLAVKSYDALLIFFQQIEKGTMQRRFQDPSQATYARKLKKEDGRIDWTKTAEQIDRVIRGTQPWPLAFTSFQRETFQILQAKISFHSDSPKKPGQILGLPKNAGIEIQTGKGQMIIEIVKPSGKKQMSAWDFANGARLKPGLILG